MLICFNCSKEISVPKDGRIGRRDECLSCGADVHCCRNCTHFDPRVYNECRETIAETVKEKDRANFCDHFSARVGGSGGVDEKDKVKAAAEALFKKS
jgi:hypothetical protein